MLSFIINHIADGIIYLFMAILFYFGVIKKDKGVLCANFIATLGMIGTFWGIYWGLQDFNAENITDSIPTLLEGMKTAFMTSLVGMGVSLLLKSINSFRKNDENEIDKDSTEELLKEILKRDTQQATKLNSTLEKLVNYSYNINNHLIDLYTTISTNVNHTKTIADEIVKIETHQKNLSVQIAEIEKKLKKSNDLNLINYEKIINYSYDINNYLKNISTSISKELENAKNIVATINSIATQQGNIEAGVTKISNGISNINRNIENLNLNVEEKGKAVKESLVNIEINQNYLQGAIDNYAKKADINMEDLINGLNSFAERNDIHNQELIGEFRDFAKTMAENNNKAFIQALNESMKDLNNQLTEQFGENFKELNRAVFKLVEWQENYKNTVIEVTETQKMIFTGIDKMKDDINSFADTGAKIVIIAENLNDTINNTNKQSAELNTHLTSMVELNKAATELIPNLLTINNRIAEDVEIFKNSLVTITNGVTNSTIELSKMSDEVIKESKNATNIYLENINLAVQDTINHLKEINNTLETTGVEITTKTTQQITTLNEELAEELRNNVTNINRSLEVALNESLTSLGTQLATLSNKFVKDYEPLTERLKDIVNIARGIE